MKKNVFGKQLSRDANERKALFKTLASSLVLSERIETTEAKAKAIRPYVEKLVTKAKKRSGDARQFVEPFLSKEATEKLLTDVSVRFSARNGGYTRIIKLGNRFADNAPVVLMEWVEKGTNGTIQNTKSKKIPRKVAEKKALTAKPTETKTTKSRGAMRSVASLRKARSGSARKKETTK